MLYVADSWPKAIDACKFAVAGFLDLAKAFDCLNHDILFDKLAHDGVVGNAHTWPGLRTTCVIAGKQSSLMVANCLSIWGSIISVGVSQGSILGP